MYSEGGMGEMDKLVYLELQGKMDVMELKVLKETWVPWVLLDLKGLLDKEDPSMSGGGRTHALIHQGQNSSTLDWLLELTTLTKEVVQTTFVYLKTPSTPTTVLEFKGTVHCMELSMNSMEDHLYQMFMNTMYPVLFALPHDQSYS
jgi:hypothetical protein